MPSTTTTGSSNIAILESRITADLCAGIFYTDITLSTYIGSGASNILGASLKVTNPYGVIIKNYPTSGYDIYAPLTDDIELAIPTQAGNFQYGTYIFDVLLTDADGDTYLVSKLVDICAPDSKNKTRNYGSLSARMDGNCVNGKVTIQADTVPTYKGAISTSQVNAFTLKYPTSSGLAVLSTTVGSFSAVLFEGEYRFSGEICALYSLGDNIFAKVNYIVKKFKNIRCLIDFTCIAAQLEELDREFNSDCSDAEKQATQNKIITTLRLVKTIEVLINAGFDASSYIDELEDLLGCVCTCNCAEGTPIINVSPANDVLISGCNVTKVTAGLTDTYTIDNYDYVVAVTDNGGAITITAPVLADCTQTQTITFNIATVYTQIKNQIVNSTEYNIWADFINQALIGLDGSCLGLTTSQFNALTLKQKMQAIITALCVGGDCDAIISTNAASSSSNDVILTWVNVSGVYEVDVYLDNILSGTVLTPTATFTLTGAADGTSHTYKLIPKCSNGSVGVLLTASFTYYGCPSIAIPTVSDANISDAVCPYDLSALVGALPSGIVAEWHNLNNTNAESLVVDPTSVTGGTYYVFAKNPDGCYSLGVQVILGCSTTTACSSPQNLIVEPITGDFRVRFASAAYPPPLNSYTVKRRLTADPDVSGSYTTLGTPTWNATAGKWEILDATAIDNTLYTYRAISNCASSAPYIDYTYANLTCPIVTFTPATTTMGYSFTNVGGSVDKYEVRIYDITGVTLIHTDTILPAFSTPITGTFIYLTGGTTYSFRVRVFIGTYYFDCSPIAGTTSQPDTVSSPAYMNLSNPTMSGTIEVSTVGGRTLRLANFSVCGVANASVTISGGIGAINNNITSAVANASQNVDTLLPVGSYTFTGSLTSGCTSSASIYFI